MHQRKFTIRTVEGVEFSLPLATPVSRALAWGMDAFIVLMLLFTLSQGLVMVALISRDLAESILLFGLFIVPQVYNLGFEWFWRGQTPGKRVMHLRVVDASGFKLRPSQIVLRNVLRFVDGLPALNLLGGIVCFWNRRFQRLGDIASNTLVIRVPKIQAPNLAVLPEFADNSFRKYPHLAARLRQKIPMVEAELALQALARRQELLPNARVELFFNIARLFQSRVSFPAEVMEGITDEQYVRNVLDLLYRPSTAPSSEGSSRRKPNP